MSDFLPPVVAVITADIAAYTGGLAEADTRMAAFVESQTAAIAELQARMASMGAEGAGAGLGAAAAGADTEAAAASAAAMQAENERLLASFEQVGAASAAMATEVETSYGAMASRTTELSQGMVAAEREAAAANAEVGAAMAASATQAEAGATKAAAAAGGLSKAGGLMSQVMFGAKLGLAAAAVESLKMAGDFQSATERLALSAGEDQKNIDMVRQGMLSMAGQVGYSAEQLATAMYKVESGGQHGAAGLKVLQAAAEGAKTENADLTTVADALTSALTDYHLPASAAADVTSKLVAATAQGKMTFQEMAGSMAAVLPIASANHVSLNDILGDLASMTMHGMSAQQATQNLADAIRHMTDNNGPAQKELAALGMNATEVAKQLGEKGLSGTINEISNRIQSQMGPDGMVVINLTNALKGLAPPVQDLGKKVLDGSISMKEFTASAKAMGVVNDKQVMSFATLAGSMHGIGTEAKSGAEVYQTYAGAMKKAMGDATGLNVALMIGGENAGNTARAITAVSGATAEAGGHVHGWSELQQTFNQKWAEFKDGLGAAAIQIGTALLPAVGALLGVLGGLFKLLADHPVLLVGLATVIGVALVPAIWAAVTATAAWTVALLSNPLTWVALLVAGLAMAAYELIEHWSGVAHFFEGLWDDVKTIFGKAADVVMAPIHAIETAWDSFWGGLANPEAKMANTVHGIDRVFLEIGEGARRFLATIGSILGDVGHVITTPFRLAWDAVKFIFTHSPAEIGMALGQAAGTVARDMVDFGKRAWHGAQDGITAAYHDTVDWFVALPGRIRAFLASARTWIVQEAKNIWHGAQDGIVDAYNDTIAWFRALPGRVKAFLAGARTWIVQEAKNIWHGAQDGIVDAYNDTIAWFVALPGRVKDFFANAGTWLLQAGKDIMSGLWNGIKSFFSTITDGITTFIGGFIGGFTSGFKSHSPSQVMHDIGDGVMTGFGNGILGKMGWLGGMPGQAFNMIVGPFSNAGSWLLNAGGNVIIGLGNGMSQLAGWLWSKAASIAQGALNAAKSALGIASPSVPAAEFGRFLVQGLALGIDDNAHLAITAAQSMATRVAGAMTGITGSAQLNLSSTSNPFSGNTGAIFAQQQGSTSGGDSTVTNVNVHVQGHVWKTQDLVKEIQQQLLRHGIRNNSSGIDYSFG